MICGTASLVTLATFLTIAFAAPAGSKHNVYLAHCTPTICPIGLCGPGDFSIAAVAYYASSSTTPTAVGKLGGSTAQWEGATRSVTLATTYTFRTQIDAAAASVTKGGIAGNATLSNAASYSEPYVCFRDGTTKFGASYDQDDYTCTADYWCGSVDVSGT